MKLVPENINEAIKHLKNDRDERKIMAENAHKVWTMLKPHIKGYDTYLEDDDTCIAFEKNGQIKFRLFNFLNGPWTDYSLYIYSLIGKWESIKDFGDILEDKKQFKELIKILKNEISS